MLFGKEGVLRNLVEKKPTFSALDLKKIANLNPNKNAGATKIVNKKESVQKIAQMFKGLIKPAKDMLESGSDGSESEIDVEMENFIKLKA